MRPNLTTLQIAFRMFLACAAGLLFAALPVRAESYVSGTYRCTTVEIDGKAAPCKAPSLILKSDGSYRMLSETGTYEILAGHWLVLSPSKRHGRAKLDGSSKEIIFTFISGGKKSKIVYRRKYQRPDGWVAG